MIYKKILIRIINFYQNFISPFLTPRCRFYPTCSQYSIEALKIFGLKKSLIKILVRLIKCHPLHKGGVDIIKFKNKLREH